MNSSSDYLPQYTLAQLSEQVCMKLPYFKNKFKTENIWDGIIQQCQLIEKDPRNVNIVTAEASNHSEMYVKEASVRESHLILTRVYILLYYRHRDDSYFQNGVFPELVARMGFYSKRDYLKGIIRDGIDKIIEFDKQVEQAMKEKKKEVKPVFAYVNHSRTEMDNLFNEYSDERLFCSMSGIINELSERYGTHLDEANVWYNAKQVVRALGQLKRPDLFIDRAATSLVMGQMYKGYEGSQIILLCVYAMVRSAKDNVHFAKFIKAMEEYANEETFKHVVFKKHIGQIKKWIDENQPFDGYDYIGGTLTAGETFTRADVERLLTEYKEREKKGEETQEEKLRQLQECEQKLSNANTKNQELEKKVEELQKQASTSRDLTTVEEMTIELFTYLFYSERKAISEGRSKAEEKAKAEDTARAFYKDIYGKDDPAIADVVVAYEDKFGSKVLNIDIYRPLHAAKIYQAGPTNFNTALNNRGFRSPKK